MASIDIDLCPDHAGPISLLLSCMAYMISYNQLAECYQEFV